MSEDTVEQLKQQMTAAQEADVKSRARISKCVADIDHLCGISKLTVDEALTSFAVIVAIKLSEMDRVSQVKWQKFFDREVKHQRKLKIELDAQKKHLQERGVVVDEAADALKTPPATEEPVNGSV